MNKHFRLFFVATLLLFQQLAVAQVDCSTLNVYTVPGKWVWQKGSYNTQWQYCESIRKEMQRIMPVALSGLYATNGIAFGNMPAVPNTPAAPKYYEYYLKLKKYECLKGYNKLQPEGETGCWIYFVVNSIFQGGASFQNGLHFGYYKNEGGLYVGDYYTVADGAGNSILYASDFGKKNQLRGYYFSAQNRLPIRKISWKELLMSYKQFTEKEINGKLVYKKEGLQKNQQELATTRYEDTKKYLTQLIEDRKTEINRLEAEKLQLNNWYNTILQHRKINDTARVKNIRLDIPEIEKLINNDNPADTYPVWIEDAGFFNSNQPKDQPQCIFLSYRRQDNEVPKKNFMDLFIRSFNLDVLAAMTGEAPRRKGGLNTIEAAGGMLK